MTFAFVVIINPTQAPSGACLKTQIDYEILDLEKWQVHQVFYEQDTCRSPF